MARALDELTEPPERKVELQKDPYGDSFFKEPSAFAEPSTITRPTSKQAYVERIKAEDLQARGIPTYRNASGGVSPITDDTGTALTAFDTRHNIAYDSAGQPKQISYDETGPPKLTDPFAQLPTRLDPKTGALGKFGPGGIYRYEGHDPKVTADLARKERDKGIARETTLLGRKLTLDEHDLRAGEADQKVLKAELKTAVPMLLDPKYEGADRDTVFAAIDEHFNAQYAAPEANDTRGWFGKELSPEATDRRKQIDEAKAKAYESATTLFDLGDQLSTLDETVRSTRQEQRVNVDTLLAHERGEEGPLDQPATAATPEGVTKSAQLYPPEEEWSRMLGGKDAVTQIQDKVRKAEVPAPAAPAVLAATHDLKDAQAKAEQFKDKDPTLYEQYSNIVAQILHGLTTGVAELGKGSFNEPSWSMIVNPLQQHGLMASWMQGAVTGQDPKQMRAVAREEWGKLPKETEQLVDERLKDTIGSKIANFGGGIAPYVAAALATKGSSAASPVLMSMFYTSGYQRTYEDAKARGVDDDHAQAAAVGVGAINAVLAMPLRLVGKAAQAIFGDTAPKVVERAITNAMEHGGPAAVGKLLGQLAEQIKAGGPGAAALKEEAVAGINSIIKEINKTGVERLATVAKTAAGHAALGTGVAMSENLIKKTYNPEQGTFENVPEMALGFGVLGTMSAGFKQIFDARKAKQALDLIAKKGGTPPPAAPPGLGPGPAPKPTAPAAPTVPKVRETSPKTAPAPGEKLAKVREISPTAPAVKPAQVKADLVAAEKAYVETGGHADKLEGQTKLEALRRQYPDEPARLAAIQERLAPSPEASKVNIVDAEAHAAATSPTNSLAEPSPAQKQAGNYQKGHVQISGLDVSIENPAGSKRKPEYRPLESHYGYIRGTVGADKDHVDIFVKKETPADWDGPVFVVNQVNAKGKFDEHKAVIGVKNQSEALAEYNSNYQPGWKGAASVVKFENASDFKAWAESGATGEPASQTAVRIRPPEGGKMHKPQIDEPHIVATAVKSGEKYLVGSKWNEPHEGIGIRHGIEKLKPADRGFIVQDADGGQRFVSRKEAGPIAQKAGQNTGPLSAEGVQSAELQPAKSRAENKVANLAKGTMAKHRSTLATLGHDVAPRVGKTDNESGIQAKLNRQGVPMVTIDPKKLAKATEGMDDRALSKYVQRAIEEEILHVGALRWELQAPENNVAIKEWGSEKDELDKFLSESYPGWEDLSERQKGHEKLRSVLQKRWTGKLTEAATRVIKAFLKYLRGIYEKLTPAQREIVDGVETILKGNKAEMKPPAKATPQVPTGETKYVLPSFVTAPHAAKKPTKLDARAGDLTSRVEALPSEIPKTDLTVIQTLLRSRTGVALDQAEKKIAKLEEKYASKVSGTEEVGVRSEGGSVGEGAPLRQPREIAKTGEEKPVGRAGPSSLDEATQKELTDAFEGLFAGLPKNLTDRIQGAQVSEGDLEALRAHNLLRLGATPESAVKLGGAKQASEEASDKIIRQMREGLGAGIPQLAIPAEKIGPFVTVAGKLVAQGVDTPQKLAAELETLFAGKARPFSQALWDAIGMVRPELRGTHDWNAIYAPQEEPKPQVTFTGPGTAAPAMVLPQNRDQLVRQVSLSLQSGPVTRRQLTEMAKESGLDVKRVDEAAETGIVMAARDIAEPLTEQTSPLVIFDQMVELYDRQPNLTAKTSTSKVDQAYSTPVPLAYAASRLADIRGARSIYEPTAGNGILLVEADPATQTVFANEINAHRLGALKAQGFEITANDATSYLPPQKVQRVQANPPFGTVLDANSEKKTWGLWDKATDQIDHAIAAKALEAMEDDGRAVLILGGKNMRDPDERAKAYIGSENQRNFWPELYRRYNVVDHFTIDGDLYAKQGAGWPVDVVVIAGRGNSRIQLPSAEPPRILTSWSELRDELGRTDEERIEAGRYNLERDREKVGGIVDSVRGAAESKSGIGPKADPQRAPATDGGGRRAESVAPTVRSEPEPPARREPQPSDVAPARGAGELGARATDVEPLERGQQLAFRVPYKPASKLDSFGIFIPTNMEAPAREALARLSERIGPIDEYVRKKLGYPEGATLKNYFSAEQMDALALGIDAIDGETAFVLGDQGGVGKGRVAAGMIAYAKQQGKVPIFITKDEKLYAAMIEDLHDIGQDHVVPVFTNNGIEFEDYSGTKWKQGSMTQVMKELARTGKLPMHADVLFTTYSQIQTDVPAGYTASKAERASLKSSHKAPPDGVRMEALKKLAPGSIIIADESHLAAGDSIRAWRLSPLLAQAHGVYYSSATFAKRPDSMGIYSRTSLSHASQSMEDLVDAMKQGGVPLQQVVSATLASDGLYLRRERDFSKAVFRTQINVETRERDARLADNYTEGLRSILNISNKMKSATDFLNKILRREAKQMHVENAPRVESTNFSSKLHNLVSQYLFAIKAEAMVRRAVEGVTVGFPNKAGDVLKHKVIIAVQNTMEQPILALERSAHPLNFKGMLLQYLDTQRVLVSGRGPNAQVTRISDKPDPNFERYSDRDLQRLIIVPNPKNPEETGVNEPALNELFRRIIAGAFKEAEGLIESLDLADMPLSPIDHIRQKLSQAGIKNAEITKRGTGIDEDGQIYKLDASSNTKAAHLRYMSDFNNGDTDVMVINASGSTGISLHSSQKFKRTDPRAMIIGQPHLDINEFMQTLYRTDRTGQVHQPYYELLQTAIPAELRPAAILNRKMGSLNANTTSNAENEISAGNVGVDIFNQYGDEVVYNYLKSDRVFTDMLDMPKIMGEGGLSPIKDVLDLYEEDGQFAAAVTGRVAVLPTSEQEEFWSKVSADYVAKINYLNELGENELQAEAIDMKAETLDRKELTPAVVGKGRASGFDQPSHLERIKADIGMKPLPGAEVITMMEELGARAYDLRQGWITRAEAWKKAELERLATKVLSWDSEKRSHYEARWREQEEEINAAIGLIGDGLHLKTEKGLDGYGAITDVKFDDEHPLTPSKQIFTVHVNTTKKVLRVAASQLPSIARMAVGDFADLYEATAERSNVRYMITGNLLSAYLAIRDAAPSAKIVQYTTNEGEMRQGILMPVKFAPGALSKKRVVESASHMRTLLDAGRGLTNADSSVSIVKPSGTDYVMRVPSSRVMGGAYWRDSQLAGLMAGGEFVERSGAMIGKFDAATLPKVYQRLLDLNASLFFTDQGEALSAGKPYKAPLTQAGLAGGDEIFEGDRVRYNGKSGTVSSIKGSKATVALDEGGIVSEKLRRLRLERPFEAFSEALYASVPFRDKSSDRQKDIAKKRVGTLTDDRPPMARLTEWWNDFRHDAARNFEAGVFDTFAPLKQGGVDAWKAAHLTQELPSVMKHLLEHGQIKFDGTWFRHKAGTRGLLPALAPVLNHPTKAQLWELYVSAYRAKRLLKEGREHNFGREGDTWDATRAKEEIDEALDLAKTYPEFEEARQEYADFNRSILDLAERTELINAGQRLTFENEDYVPFYRMIEEAEIKGPGTSRGIANQRAKIRKLRGGTQKVAVLENIYRNLETMIDAAYKNAAMLKIAEGFKETGVLVPEPKDRVVFHVSVGEIKAKLKAEGIELSGSDADDMVEFWRARAPKDPDVISVMRGGKPEYYRVTDPLLLRAVLDLGQEQFGWLVNTMGKFRSLLTQTVTLDPVFNIANFMRDTLAAWIQHDGKITPGISAAKGLLKAFREGEELQEIMAGGGGLGTYHRLSEKEVRKRFMAHAKSRNVVVDTPLKIARMILSMQRASENANRVAVFDDVVQRGGTSLEAAFAAKDVLNFTARGGFTTVKLLVRVLPFFNARLQGLNKLGRSSGLGGGGFGGGGGGPKGPGRGSLDGGGNPKTFFVRAGLMMAVALALATLASDEEEYAALEDWDRDTYFHFWIGKTHVRIPKPFELGLLFATIPERITQMFRTGDAKQLGRSFVDGLSNTLAFNPVPQMIRPGLEGWANKNAFTGRPIVSPGMEFQAPEGQFTPATSETFKLLAKAMPDSSPEWMRSPVRLEALFRGYFAALGMYAVGVTDAILSKATNAPEKPGRAVDKIPIINQFMRRFLPDDEGRSSRFVGEFYDLQKEVGRTVRQIKELESTGNWAEAAKLRREKAELLDRSTGLNAVEKLLKSTRKEKLDIHQSRLLSGAQKASAINNLTRQTNEAARAAVRYAPADRARIAALANSTKRGKKMFTGF